MSVSRETQEANKLIAEFMNSRRYTSQDRYHASWDWLMPVITKLKCINPYWIEEEAQHIIDQIDDGLTCCWGIDEVHGFTVRAIVNYNNWNTTTNK